ncbi:MAG: hypothetical protein ACT4PX_06555 [Actinomycetota bacterium]
MKCSVMQTPGGDPQALRRLSRVLEAGASELQRVRRRVDEAGAVGQHVDARELDRVARWLDDRSVDIRRRALRLESDPRRSPFEWSGPAPMAPWFGGDRCPSALITVQVATGTAKGRTETQASEHIPVRTSCTSAATSLTAVLTASGPVLAPGMLRLHDSDGHDDGGAPTGRRAARPAGEPVPKGFGTRERFAAFGRRLLAGLRSAGFADARAGLQGSSVTGVSYRTGAPFDLGRTSDLDVTVASSTAMDRARALGIALRSDGTRTGPLTTTQLERLGLGELAERLKADLGREVHFMLYESLDVAAARGPLVVVPGP